MEIEKRKGFSTKDITLMALFTILLFAQEQILSFFPNVQLTIFLLILFSKKLGFGRTTVIIGIHVLLDNLVMGSFNLIFIPVMFAAYLVIPLTITTIFKKVDSNLPLALLGIAYSFIYSWAFIIPCSKLFGISYLEYLTADIVFETIFAASSFLSVLLLYKPMSKVMDEGLKWQNN